MTSDFNTGTTIAVAWYREDQWDRLRELSRDRADLAESYDDWLRGAERKWRELTATGLRLRRVDIDVELLWSWCFAHRHKLDAAARSLYAAQRSRELDQATRMGLPD